VDMSTSPSTLDDGLHTHRQQLVRSDTRRRSDHASLSSMRLDGRGAAARVRGLGRPMQGVAPNGNGLPECTQTGARPHQHRGKVLVSRSFPRADASTHLRTARRASRARESTGRRPYSVIAMCEPAVPARTPSPYRTDRSPSTSAKAAGVRDAAGKTSGV
jgi:hypothetical protein